ncbi:MAG TPA: type VI secretion system tube protein Hcp [Fimbriiglobus sp.]|jgi:type VI secretion system secreted protein Hcp|nr:type VI secretion system tube protein Hcp [Fimbriiglobus sp.]
MAFDAYMYFEEPGGGAVLPEGETSDKEFAAKKAFEVFSFSLGASNPTTIGSGSGGASSGRVSYSTVNVMKRTDKSSPKLVATCNSGGHFGKVTLVLRKSGQDKAKAGEAFLTYEFHKVFVDSIQWSGSSGGDDVPTESLSLAFGAIKIGYKPQNKDGSLGTEVPATWSLIKNDNSTSV